MEEHKRRIRVKRHLWPDEIAKQKQKTMKRFALLAACLICFLGGFSIAAFSNVSIGGLGNTKISEDEKLQEIFNILSTEWYFSKEVEDIDAFLKERAIDGVTISEYDIHTNYLGPEDAAEYLSQLEGNFVGVGMVYSNVKGAFIIQSTYPNSPASEAGLQPGDIITKVNGVSVEGKTTDEVADLALGESGTIIKIEYIRLGATHEVEMTRRSISTTVYGYIENNVGILEISSFAETSTIEVQSYLTQFNDAGVDEIIIDMRGNTGGYLITCVEIANFFLEKGSVVLKEQDKEGNIKEFTTSEEPFMDFEDIVVLVDENTASAAEALTAALSDNLDNVDVVGMTTYGKGTVQQSRVFEDGSYLKYTIAEWLTPLDEKIHEVGITPDVEVSLPLAVNHYTIQDDSVYYVDSVAGKVMDAQIYLQFLGYDVDRVDGYYSQSTKLAVEQFKADLGLLVNDAIDNELLISLISSSKQKWYQEESLLDTQIQEAYSIIEANN